MSLTASIVAYHTPPAELEGVIDSLLANGVKRIYVVDNSSSDVVRDKCREYTGVTYIPAENRGYGAGHNLAIRRVLDDAGVKYHLVVNSDILFPASTLCPLTDYMDAHQEVGLVQPRIVGPDGRLQSTARMLPTTFDLIIRRFLPGGWFSKSRARYELQHIDHSRPFAVAYLQGSFMLFRCDALRVTGLFDERFFMYPEDIDITRRVAEGPYKAMYVPLSTVTHHHRRASYRSMRMLAVHCINMVRYFNKWGWFRDDFRKKINTVLK